MSSSLVLPATAHHMDSAVGAVAYGGYRVLPDGDSAEFIVRQRESSYRSLEAVQAERSLIESWLELQTECNSTCVGIICHAGSHCGELAELIVHGFDGAPLPGAIVIVGCDLVLLGRLLELAQQHPRPYMLRTPSGCVPFEWPAIMMIANIADPALAEALKIGRELDGLALPLHTTVVSDLRRFGQGSLPAEVTCFFADHLVVNFPKMF